MTINPLDYPGGGTPLTGNAAVDTAALQWSIDQATGNADPASTSRAATDTIYWPPGVWKVNAPITIKSVVGFKLVGAGRITRLQPTTTLSPLLDIDGLAYSELGGFHIESGDTTNSGPTVDKLISYQWTPAVARSTSSNYIHHITTANTKFRVGIGVADLAGSDARQIDNTVWDQINIAGVLTTPYVASGVYDTGIIIGRNGSGQGNVIQHEFRSCGVSQVSTCWEVNNCASLHIRNPRVGHAATMLRTAGGFNITCSDFRTEHVHQILYHVGGTAPANIEFSNFLHDSIPSDVSATGHVFDFRSAGTLTLRNAYFASLTPQSHVYTAIGSPHLIRLDNVQAHLAHFGPGIGTFVQPVAGTPCKVVATGYTYRDPATGLLTINP